MKLIVLLTLVATLLSIILIGSFSDAKHHRRYSCSTFAADQRRCPVHTHKICGSDGKLYPSRCHLRRTACETGTNIRPAHPDRCLREDDHDDQDENREDGDEDEATIMVDDNSIEERKKLSHQAADNDLIDTQTNENYVDRDLSSTTTTSPSNIADNQASSTIDDYSEEDECKPKDYDLMKEKVLNKINDVSLLFTRLDENSDGQITLNELWKHSMIYKSPEPGSSISSCLLTDLMQHEDANEDEKLDYSEFQSAFNKLFSVTMVTLDESLAVNRVEAHLGDNVEIRCDIDGEPQRPAIKWYRHGVDLSTLNFPNIKVFGDGALYLTDLRLSFSGNYTCEAVNNPTVKQTHVVRVIVNPIVEVSPRFQWTPIGGVASFECRYETFADDDEDEDSAEVRWYKNDQQLLDENVKVTITNNGTRLQVAALEQIDTGAYECKVSHRRSGAYGVSVASLLVQDDTVQVATSAEMRPQRLWIFHAAGLTVYEGICGQPIHEIDARDIIYPSGVTLCGRSTNDDDDEQDGGNRVMTTCEWSDDVIAIDDRVVIAQPNLNRVIIFHASQLTVAQVIATDANPRRLWAAESAAKSTTSDIDNTRDAQIWLLCDGNDIEDDDDDDEDELRKSEQQSPYNNKKKHHDHRSSRKHDRANPLSDAVLSNIGEKYMKNRKTIQVIRLPTITSMGNDAAEMGSSSSSSNTHRGSHRQADVIHLQPIDGHFDLVYDLFVSPRYESIFKSETKAAHVRDKQRASSISSQSSLSSSSSFAYATHWEERSLVKISVERLEYMQSIPLADCQPISAAIITRRAGGLVAVQCQTPVTHRLNGQLILDQVTDAILSHNTHLNAHRSYLSPDHRYLVNILHEHSNATRSSSSSCSSSAIECHDRRSASGTDSATTGSNTSTIIVQRVTSGGVEFLYDVRTSLDIVSCVFVWKSGAYDLVLASGTRNREDLLYLSLNDGHVELISGIGRPTEGYRRGMALSTKNRVLSITATESIYTVDLNTNRILCESSKHFEKPRTLIWTN